MDIISLDRKTDNQLDTELEQLLVTHDLVASVEANVAAQTRIEQIAAEMRTRCLWLAA